MIRSRWLTILALFVFFAVTAQLVHFSWKKSRERALLLRAIENDTPEAKAERRAKDEITKKAVEEMIGKAIAQRKK